MSRDDIHAMVNTLGGLLNALRHADPADKAEVYRELGVRLTYNHTEHTILAETRPTSSVCVVSVSEGGLEHAFVAYLHRAGVHATDHSCMQWRCVSRCGHVVARANMPLSSGVSLRPARAL
jgi:hypothetical protein